MPTRLRNLHLPQCGHGNTTDPNESSRIKPDARQPVWTIFFCLKRPATHRKRSHSRRQRISSPERKHPPTHRGRRAGSADPQRLGAARPQSLSPLRRGTSSQRFSRDLAASCSSDWKTSTSQPVRHYRLLNTRNIHLITVLMHGLKQFLMLIIFLSANTKKLLQERSLQKNTVLEQQISFFSFWLIYKVNKTHNYLHNIRCINFRQGLIHLNEEILKNVVLIFTSFIHVLDHEKNATKNKLKIPETPFSWVNNDRQHSLIWIVPQMNSTDQTYLSFYWNNLQIPLWPTAWLQVFLGSRWQRRAVGSSLSVNLSKLFVVLCFFTKIQTDPF